MGKNFRETLNQQLKNPEFKKEWDALEPEFDIIKAIVNARSSQNMTQKELSEKTGIPQADISRLENGTRNPTLKLLKRLADGLNMELGIVFVPKKGIK
ncbi:MAG TPA: helix-turn-helix transcriptional regulator [Candidatus Mediterraneibacter guildfordensis]|nr:helix-turn-helix transcriptional regulator [Candidatus Mediterraneibacter guildfordensis]